ncbi:major capsid protein [Lacticaseibacillus saniviri]
MANIFDDINSANIAAYWETKAPLESPYFGETLFPNMKQATKDIDYLKGKSRAPKPLAPTAPDTQAIMRDRQGLEKIHVETKAFKEGKYIDEELREQLVRVANSPYQSEREVLLTKIFDEPAELLRGAALVREIMRMQVLQTGKYHIIGNGQIYDEDFEMKAEHITGARTSWLDASADPAADFQAAIDKIGEDEGSSITRVVMNAHTFRALVANNGIKSTLLANNANTAAVSLPRQVLMSYLKDEFGLSVGIYDKGYVDEKGKLVKFIPDGNVVFLPAETVGATVFSATPEETDLMAKPGIDLSIVDTGVAITTTLKDDPVTTFTKVSQKVTPTFEKVDGVYVLHAFETAEKPATVQGGVTPPEA